MSVIKADFTRSRLRQDVIAEQFDLEIGYLQVMQSLHNVCANVTASRDQLSEGEIEELCRRLRVAGEQWLADSIAGDAESKKPSRP